MDRIPDGFILGHKFQAKKKTPLSALFEENQPETIKPVYSNATDIFYDLYFYGGGFKSPSAKHDRRMKDSKLVYTRKEVRKIDKFKESGFTKPIEKIDYSECHDTFFDRTCNHPIVSNEEGITVCEGCGHVLGYLSLNNESGILGHDGNYPEPEEEPAKKKKKLSKTGRYIQRLMNNKRYYKMLTEKKPKIDGNGDVKYKDNSMKSWRKKQKFFHVGTVSTKYMMTGDQKKEAKEIIEKIPLNKIHSRINERAIILGICIYVMKKRGRHILINKNKYCEELGLNKPSYNVIKRNLDRLLK